MSPMFAIGMFELFGVVALVVVVVGALVWFLNSRAFRDMLAAGRAQVGKAGQAAIAADPKAVFEQEVRDAKDELNRSITDLEESKGLVTQLQDQVKEDQREVNKLDSKVRNSLTDDPEDKGGKAGEYVMQLQAAQANFTRNSEQLKQAQTIYSNNLQKFQLAQKKIRQKEERGRQLGSEVKSSEMNARLAKLAQKFNVDVGGLDSRLNEAEAEMRKQIAQNNAVSEVQTDLGLNGLEEAKEEERLAKVEANKALDAYREKMKAGK